MLALLVGWNASTAIAQVPDATIQRLADLYVRQAENNYLSNSRQIDGRTYGARRDSINGEFRILLAQVEQFSDADQQRATSQINGLKEARLAILTPQWKAKEDQLKQLRKQHDRALADSLAADVRSALEPQRRRALLAQRRERNEITAEDFAAEDKKALDEIMAIRAKYAAEGDVYASQFDHDLAVLTQTIARNPAATLPVPRVPATPGGTSASDYQKDVKLAADVLARWNAVRNRYSVKKDIDITTLQASERVYSGDIARLSEKWRAAGRGNDFERDYRRPIGGPVVSSPANVGAPKDAPLTIGEIGRMAVSIGGLVAGLALLFYLFHLFVQAQMKPSEAPPVSDVHGTAHYAPVAYEVTSTACLANGLFFGKSCSPEVEHAPFGGLGAPICSTPEHHTLIVARTRTGKGTRVIVPTLLRYTGSALVIDPKGENAAITARARAVMSGQKIRILNPWNELHEVFQELRLGKSATYNPLDILDRFDPNVVAIAQTLAGAICPAPANAKDRFWQGSAANILTAVFLWLTDQPTETKTLGRAREIISLSRKDFTAKYLVPMAASQAFSGAIRELAAPFIDLAPETYSGVISNLSESTKFLSDPQVKAATASSSFSMEELVTGKSTVYVVIPTERMDAQKTWLRLVVSSAMHSFKRPRKPGESRKRCLFLIDEFAALGRLDDMPRDIATMSGFGVDFALVVQGLDQLKDQYGDASATILSNCAYKWFCNVSDLESAKYLSQTLGTKTVVTNSTSNSTSADGKPTTSYTQGETGRSLLNPDEILNLGRNVAITLQPHGHPHYLRPIDYWNLPKAFANLQATYHELYWDNPKLQYDGNPYAAQ